MAQIALKLSTMFGEIFENKYFQMGERPKIPLTKIVTKGRRDVSQVIMGSYLPIAGPWAVV